MKKKFLTTFSLLCFGLLSLALLHVTKKPLCIDSKVVERIDMIDGEKAETIFRCSIHRHVPYSPYFVEKLKTLTERVQTAERLLESIEPFNQRVQVAIVLDRPFLFKIRGHQILIGEGMLKVPGHLEKALSKIWYREKNQTLFAQQAVMEEVFTDFLVFLQRGSLRYGDPESVKVTALAPVKWPFVLKSGSAYCESGWKQSEHYEYCKDLSDEDVLDQEVVEMSLRPLLATSWVESYKSLSVKERYEFNQLLTSLLRKEHEPALPIVSTRNHPNAQATQLLKAAEVVKNVNAFVAHSKLKLDSDVHKFFVSYFTDELRKNGFQGSFAEAAFDVLFISEDKLAVDSPTLKHFRSLAKENPQLQMAVQDSESLWMLPSRYPISLNSFGQIRATRVALEKCGGYDFSFVLGYADKTEKLLIINNCDHKVDFAFKKFLKEGAAGFGSENKGMAFVQFHMPSLLMKRQELEAVNDVFEFIQKRDVESPSFKSLGWQEVRWSEQSDAYQPKAFVDAIEWFRIPN